MQTRTSTVKRVKRHKTSFTHARPPLPVYRHYRDAALTETSVLGPRLYHESMSNVSILSRVEMR